MASDWSKYINLFLYVLFWFHLINFSAFWKYLLLWIILRALNLWKISNTCKTLGKFCPNLWSTMNLDSFPPELRAQFSVFKFFCFCLLAMFYSHLRLTSIKGDPRSVLEWSYPLLAFEQFWSPLSLNLFSEVHQTFKLFPNPCNGVIIWDLSIVSKYIPK